MVIGLGLITDRTSNTPARMSDATYESDGADDHGRRGGDRLCFANCWKSAQNRAKMARY